MSKLTNRSLTAERLREVLDYDPETGLFRWKPRKTLQKRLWGKEAGSISHYGYVVISVDERDCQASRLAWLWVYGVWPDGQVDHKDTVRTNNMISNLRVATSLQNKGNMRVPSHNKSGVKGVHWDRRRQKWQANIKINRRNRYIGQFDRIEDAAAAYLKAAQEYFGEFARGHDGISAEQHSGG